MEVSLIFLVILVIFLGSLTRSTFGFGDWVVSIPLLALLPLNKCRLKCVILIVSKMHSSDCG